MIIVMLGPQGSGKGTHAKLLGKKMNIEHLSMGDALREAAKSKSALGEKLKKILKTGKLVPFELTIKIFKNEIEKPKYKKGVILDGFPRDMDQVHALDKLVKVDKVIVLLLSDKEAVNRLGGRRTCKECGEIYHIRNKKSKKRGICDVCKGELIKRVDDKPDAIKQRLKVYHSETEDVIKHYAKKGLIIEVSSHGPIKTVENRLEKAVLG